MSLENEINHLDQDLEQFQKTHSKIKQKLDKLQKKKNQLEQEIDLKSTAINEEELQDFVSGKNWLINEKGNKQYEIIIPKFIDRQVGVLDRQVGEYNVFYLDQTTKMITGVPSFLEDDVELEDSEEYKVKDEMLEYKVEKEQEVKEKFSDHVEKIEDGKAQIKTNKRYGLLDELLELGYQPFTPQPVDKKDLRPTETKHELRSYQKRAYDEWLEHGAVTNAFMTGAGKTHVGIESLDALKYDKKKGRKAVIVFSRITGTQWKNRIEEYAPRLKPVIMSGTDIEDIPDEKDIVEIYTYQSIHKLVEMINKGHEYIKVDFDEGDFVGADKFQRASTLPIKYRMGHTATPIRNQENPNKVFALCGKPVGLKWQETIDLTNMEMFPVHIHTVEDQDSKIQRLKDIIEKEETTVIVVEKISFGEEISEELGIEFVHGQTNGDQKEKIEKAIEKNNHVVASRIVRRGVSLDTVENLIEIDRRGDSRRDTLQAVGRLFHGRGKEANLIYTIDEADKYNQSIEGLIEKGFEIKDVDKAFETDFENKKSEINIELPEKTQETPSTPKPNTQETRTKTKEEHINTLKREKVKELVQNTVENADSGVKKDDLKKAIIAIAQSGEQGLTNQEVAKAVGKPSRSNKWQFTKPFKDKNLVKKEEGKHILDIENIEEIIKKHEEEKKLQEKTEELKNELL